MDEIVAFFDAVGNVMGSSNANVEKLVMGVNEQYVVECQHVRPSRTDGLNLDQQLCVLWSFENGKYFTSHGPATVKDFTWWSGLSTADARAGPIHHAERGREPGNRTSCAAVWSLSSAASRAGRYGGIMAADQQRQFPGWEAIYQPSHVRCRFWAPPNDYLMSAIEAERTLRSRLSGSPASN